MARCGARNNYTHPRGSRRRLFGGTHFLHMCTPPGPDPQVAGALRPRLRASWSGRGEDLGPEGPGPDPRSRRAAPAPPGNPHKQKKGAPPDCAGDAPWARVSPRHGNAPSWSAASCSPTDYSAVPSALGGLTSGFGMGPGVPPLPWSLTNEGHSAVRGEASAVPWGPHSVASRRRSDPRDRMRPNKYRKEELGLLVPLG